ncbi:exodeoxyribonuclease VII large subunit [Methylotenera versatilis]|uniref:exodeoxyribonuclease VII large subunit n=1 Tax=Methylotenera versatilis TaxID=1055487 RepID=UPI000647872C
MPDNVMNTHVMTVSELNRLAREVLEQSFPLFWVSGEVSNFVRAASGHWYFSLKDQGAQVKCVMFKGRNSYVDFTPREGDKIEARATVTLYEARGDFQLTVEFVQKAGLGALFEAFEKLKAKLAHEGLFDAAYKQAIPTNPLTIGIVTSPDAAALRDVLTTLKRRNPNIKVIIYPTPVQGKSAAQLIAKAIHAASKRAEVDTLIICRGGGSMEDLWQFNEEVVARAIDDCPIPTISGVGHETDFTICDFVADMRAATPTAAAELACADIRVLKNQIVNLQNRLNKQINFLLNQTAQKLDFLARRLISPAQQIENRATQIKQLQHRLNLAFQQNMQTNQHRLLRLSSSIEQLNPNAVLARGYAIVHSEVSQNDLLNPKSAELIIDAQQITPESRLNITFYKGSAKAQVISVKKST